MRLLLVALVVLAAPALVQASTAHVGPDMDAALAAAREKLVAALVERPAARSVTPG